MLFGNWVVKENSIEWNSDRLHRFVIPKESINTIRKNHTDNSAFYDWILLATEEDWLTQNDLYDLNFAFVYAVAKYKVEFSYDVFDATLAEQYEQFEDEDKEDFDL